MQFEYASSFSKKNSIKERMCSHLSKGPKEIDLQKAIVYLKLKELNCSKKAARNFTSKKICKSDSTLARDGPAECRKLKVRPSDTQITVKGWKNIGHQYEMGKGYNNGLDEDSYY